MCWRWCTCPNYVVRCRKKFWQVFLVARLTVLQRFWAKTFEISNIRSPVRMVKYRGLASPAHGISFVLDFVLIILKVHFLLSINIKEISSLVGDILLGSRLFWTNDWFHLMKNIGFVNWNLKNTLVRLVFAFGNGKSKNAESQHGPFLKFQECCFTNLQKCKFGVGVPFCTETCSSDPSNKRRRKQTENKWTVAAAAAELILKLTANFPTSVCENPPWIWGTIGKGKGQKRKRKRLQDNSKPGKAVRFVKMPSWGSLCPGAKDFEQKEAERILRCMVSVIEITDLRSWIEGYQVRFGHRSNRRGCGESSWVRPRAQNSPGMVYQSALVIMIGKHWSFSTGSDLFFEHKNWAVFCTNVLRKHWK